MGKCGECRLYNNGTCRLPIWKDGAFYSEHVTQEAAGCHLFEEKEEKDQ